MKSTLFFLFLILFASLAQADSIHLATGSFDPLFNAPMIPQNLKSEIPLTGKGYYFLQFKSFPEEAWIDELSSRATFFEYYPDNTYLIGATPTDITVIQSHPAVRWVGLYHPFYKLNPEIGKRPFSSSRRMKGSYYLVVELFPDADVAATVSAIERLGGNSLKIFHNSNNTRLKVLFPPSSLADLARIPGVQWVEEESERTLRNDVTRWVIQSNVEPQTPIWDKGIRGEGQVIGHIDGLISPSSCYFAEPGKIIAIHNQSGTGVDSHGTHTAATAAGNKAGFSSPDSGDGNAFAAKLAHTNLDDLDVFVTLGQALSNDHNDGARIHTNSWGDDSTTSYTSDCRDIDLFSRNNEDDLVIFAATNGLASVKTPENAKNVLAVGASVQAPNQKSRYAGGTGPTADGRRKPEIYAPGKPIFSADTSSCGTASKSGTSMAAPAIAGTAALTRQYYLEGWYPTGAKNPPNGFTPSGALIKATLLNGTVDMTGPVNPTDPNILGYPSNAEGWGRLLLDNALHFAGDTQSLIVEDIRNADGFSAAGTTTYNFTISSSGQPLKVTLVWTDLESAVNSSGTLLKNDLNLEVTTANGTFKGNVFNTVAGESQTGGTADSKNNVEQVLINSLVGSNLTIKVIAQAILPATKQGYALVVTGGLGQQCTTPPPAPANLTVTPGTNQNSLTWNAVSGATYLINRNTTGCGGGATFQFFAPASSTSFLDTGLSGGTTYGYQVVAEVDGCQSAPSACASGTPSGGSFLFFDDFEDGSSSDWTVTGKGTGAVNGNNQFTLAGARKITAAPPAAFIGCDDCILGFDMIVDSGKTFVYFPWIDKKNYRQIIFLPESGKIILKEKVNGVKTNKIAFKGLSIPIGQSFPVLIENNGNTVTITVNGNSLPQQVMSNFGNASFQLQNKDGSARFDNVTVLP